MKEKDMQHTINQYLDLVLVNSGRGWYMHLHESPKFCPQCRRVIAPGKAGLKGIPDVIGGVKDDRGYRLFALEIKRKGNKPTDHQLACMEDLRSRGFSVAWHDTIEKCLEFLNTVIYTTKEKKKC